MGAALALLMVLQDLSYCQIPNWTVNDIKGKPSVVVAKSTTRKVRTSRTAYQRKRTEFARVASAAGAKATSQIVKAPKPIQLVYGRLTLVLEEETRPGITRALSDPPEVTITLKGKTYEQSYSPTTATANRLVFEKIGPLPASVTVNLRDEEQYSIRTGTDVVFAITRGATAWNVAGSDDSPPDYSGWIASLKPMLAARPAPRPAPRKTAPKPLASQLVALSKTIVLTPNYADVILTAPKGSQISVPVGKSEPLGDAIQIGEAISSDSSEQQEQHLRFHRSVLESGTPSILLSRQTETGDFEGRVELGRLEFGEPNRVTAPPTRLVALKSVDIRAGVSVLDGADPYKKKLEQETVTKNAAGTKGKAKPSEFDPGDGSKWLVYEPLGLAVRTRRLTMLDSKKPPEAVEQIRITSVDGGSVAGIKVGDPIERVTAALGEPDQLPANGRDRHTESVTGAGKDAALVGNARTNLSYLDGGVVFGTRSDTDGTVDYIDVRRPTELLAEGTTAFAKARPISVFVSNWGVGPGVNLPAQEGRSADPADDVRQMISKMGVVKLADTAAEADYVLTGSISRYEEDPVRKFPSRFDSRTVLSYRLTSASSIEADSADSEITGVGTADFRSDVSKGAVIYGIAIALLSRDKLTLPEQLLLAVIGVGAVSKLQKAMGRAIPRCRSLSYQDAMRQLADSLYERADVTARATWIDVPLITGKSKPSKDELAAASPPRLGFNIGRDSGVEVGSEFVLDIAGKSLEGVKPGLKADYLLARAVEVSDESCICELRHVKREYSSSGKESCEDKPAYEEARGIPEPASGLVSGRIHTQFLKLAGMSLETVKIPVVFEDNLPEDSATKEGS